MDEDGSCQKGRVETDYVSALYRENTTPGIRKGTIRIFMHEGGYGIFTPAMLVLCITISCLISPLNTHIS